MTLQGEKSGVVFKVGQQIRIKLVRADKATGEIDYLEDHARFFSLQGHRPLIVAVKLWQVSNVDQAFDRSSSRERRAIEAEREVEAMKKAEYMEELAGRLTGNLWNHLLKMLCYFLRFAIIPHHPMNQKVRIAANRTGE